MTMMAGPDQNAGSQTNVNPPWGAFPAESYLIRHWDFDSPLSPADQRRSLISAFLEQDAFPKDWDATGRVCDMIKHFPQRRIGSKTTITRIPTQREVAEILAPWRPLRWREAALRLWLDRNDEEVWLRTYYGEGSDQKFAEMRQYSEESDPDFHENCLSNPEYRKDCRAWTVLNDQALFDGDWSAALHILPELAGPLSCHNAYSHRHLRDPVELEKLRSELHGCAMLSVMSALRLEGQGNNGEKLKIDIVEAGPVGMKLQMSVVGGYLFVADAEAFETGKLRLLFLDLRGNIVRESRVSYKQAWEVRFDWGSESGMKNLGTVLGEKYKYSGEIGKELYQIQ